MPTLPTFCATGKLECVILISILQFFSSNFVDASSLGLVKEVIGIYIMSNGTACAVNYFDSEKSLHKICSSLWNVPLDMHCYFINKRDWSNFEVFTYLRNVQYYYY